MIDPILLWNDIALEANRVDHTGAMRARNQRGPTLSSRALAMVHIALHDAYFGFVQSGTNRNPNSIAPVLPENLMPATQTPTADEIVIVTSTAAHAVLCCLYPSQEDVFDRHLSAVLSGAMPGENDPKSVGETIARNVINDRACDRSASGTPDEYSQDKGRHRPDPFNAEQMLQGKGYGKTKHFALKNGHLRLDPPPGYVAGGTYDENHEVYKEHYDEVMELGARFSSSRTHDQTLMGTFWAYDGAEEIGTPPRLYNQIAKTVLCGIAPSTPEERLIFNTRNLMLINVAMADAAIDAWHYKFDFDLWRPVLGIRERGLGLGPQANPAKKIDPAANPFWEPLGAPNSNTLKKDFTPPFPAYPSGHATFGGAAFEMLRLIAGVLPGQPDEIRFDFVSDEFNGRSKDSKGTVRPLRRMRYDSLIDAMFDNSISRVFLGVHWRFDGMLAKKPDELRVSNDYVGGVQLGRRIAIEIFNNFNKKPLKTPAAKRGSSNNSK